MDKEIANSSYEPGRRATLTRRQLLAGLAATALCGPLARPDGWGGSRVVVVRNLRSAAASGVTGVRRALDLGLSRLLRRDDPGSAWAEIVSPPARVSIKVDAVSPLSSTGDELIAATLEALFDRLVQPWEITVWDRRAADVARRSFRLRTRRGAHEVLATESANSRGVESSGYDSRCRYNPAWLESAAREPSLYTSLLSPQPTVLINMPAAKHLPGVGIDGALTSLALGSVSNTRRFFGSPETLSRAVAEIWRRRRGPLRRCALTVMDATNVVFHGGPVGLPAWCAAEDALVIGSDPVAVDAVALEKIDARRREARLPSCLEEGRLLLEAAQQAGIGSASPQVVEVNAPAGIG